MDSLVTTTLTLFPEALTHLNVLADKLERRVGRELAQAGCELRSEDGRGNADSDGSTDEL